MTVNEAIKICNTIAFAASLHNTTTPINATKDEIAEAISVAVQTLNAVKEIKYIRNKKEYPEAEDCDYGVYDCEPCLELADIDKAIEVLRETK